MADATALRCRLITFRADALRQLDAADRIEPAFLRLLADGAAALAALDAEPCPDSLPAERVVLVDDGETAVRLVAYAGASCLSTVELSPTRALTLAQALLAAALRRLAQ